MISSNDYEINKLVMQEIGLEVGPNKRIYDQDTGAAIRINNMDVVDQGSYTNSRSTEFNPSGNRKMMGKLFGYFLDKRSEETGINVSTYYNVDGNNSIECRLSDDTTIKSKSYTRDSLKYLDIMMQLNGEKNVDLKEYDQPIEKDTIKRKRKTGDRNESNTANS